jgi:hypothetical protein
LTEIVNLLVFQASALDRLPGVLSGPGQAVTNAPGG